MNCNVQNELSFNAKQTEVAEKTKEFIFVSLQNFFRQLTLIIRWLIISLYHVLLKYIKINLIYCVSFYIPPKTINITLILRKSNYLKVVLCLFVDFKQFVYYVKVNFFLFTINFHKSNIMLFHHLFYSCVKSRYI